MIVLCDTNILIEYFKGNKNTIKYIKSIDIKNICISSITLMELLVGARNKEEAQLISFNLKSFSVIHLSKKISLKAIQLIHLYSKSHGLFIPDALIASTTITENLKLLTYNVKDFKYIDGMNLYPL